MTDPVGVQPLPERRIEAGAAELMHQMMLFRSPSVPGGGTELFPSEYREIAQVVLAAADAVGGEAGIAESLATDDEAETPPWMVDFDIPDLSLYAEAELFVAGRLSTMAPFDKYHPAWCLPFAAAAVAALGDFVSTDSAEYEAQQEARDGD